MKFNLSAAHSALKEEFPGATMTTVRADAEENNGTFHIAYSAYVSVDGFAAWSMDETLEEAIAELRAEFDKQKKKSRFTEE